MDKLLLFLILAFIMFGVGTLNVNYSISRCEATAKALDMNYEYPSYRVGCILIDKDGNKQLLPEFYRRYQR